MANADLFKALLPMEARITKLEKAVKELLKVIEDEDYERGGE